MAEEELSASSGDGDLTVSIGPVMENGRARWEFWFRSRSDSCVQITCRQTYPEEAMHVCEPTELLRMLTRALAQANAHGFTEAAPDQAAAANLTKGDLDALEKLLGKATPGPWVAARPVGDTPGSHHDVVALFQQRGPGDPVPTRYSGLGDFIADRCMGGPQALADLTLAAALKNAASELIALARKGLASP